MSVPVLTSIFDALPRIGDFEDDLSTDKLFFCFNELNLTTCDFCIDLIF